MGCSSRVGGRRRWPVSVAFLLAVTTTTTLLTAQRVAALGSTSSSSSHSDDELPQASPGSCEDEREDCQADATCLECYSIITPATRDAWETCISSVSTDDPCVANGTWRVVCVHVCEGKRKSKNKFFGGMYVWGGE